MTPSNNDHGMEIRAWEDSFGNLLTQKEKQYYGRRRGAAKAVVSTYTEPLVRLSDAMRGRPQVWTDETIKDAPEGWYVGYFISWGTTRLKSDWLGFPAKRLVGVRFFGPLPDAPETNKEQG